MGVCPASRMRQRGFELMLVQVMLKIMVIDKTVQFRFLIEKMNAAVRKMKSGERRRGRILCT
jgi:hypothetical protein